MCSIDRICMIWMWKKIYLSWDLNPELIRGIQWHWPSSQLKTFINRNLWVWWFPEDWAQQVGGGSSSVTSFSGWFDFNWQWTVSPIYRFCLASFDRQSPSIKSSIESGSLWIRQRCNLNNKKKTVTYCCEIVEKKAFFRIVIRKLAKVAVNISYSLLCCTLLAFL